MAITLDDFQKVDIRVGRITEVKDGRAKTIPSYEVKVDFGVDIGIKSSSIGAKKEYRSEELIGRLVVAVVNLPPKNIAGFRSEVLILGVPGEDGQLSLLQPSRPAMIGGRMY